jgi:hypothetical protein
VFIPIEIANNIKRYQDALFYNPTESKIARTNAFYLLLRPFLDFLIQGFEKEGLSEAEAETEIYLLCVNLFNKFNIKKSSIITFLEKAIPWQIYQSVTRIRKEKNITTEGDIDEETYSLDGEVYLRENTILFEDRFLCRELSTKQKYIIYVILTSEDDELSLRKVSAKLGIDNHTLANDLLEIKKIFASLTNEAEVIKLGIGVKK